MTSDANTSSTTIGPAGSPFPSVVLSAGGRTSTFTTQYAIQDTDLVLLEFQVSGGKWQPLTTRNTGIDVDAYGYQNGTYYGVGVATTGPNTIVVSFGQYSANNSTFGAAGVAWTSVPSTARYRVRIANASSPVGQVLASATREGLLTQQDEGTFVANFNIGMNTTTNNTTVSYRKIGRFVILEVPSPGSVTASATTSAWQTAASTIPANLRPTNLQRQYCLTVNNGSTDSTIGLAVIDTTGFIQINRQVGNWTSATVNCGFQTVCFSYTTST
jgi:hypothetical protein